MSGCNKRRLQQKLTLKVLVTTIDDSGGDGGCRVGEVRAGTTSPMPDHKGNSAQQWTEINRTHREQRNA